MMYYLNVGIYNALLMSFLDQTYFDIPEPLKASRKDADLKLSRIWGPTGDGDDVIVTRCMLPEMDAGDFVIISGKFVLMSQHNMSPSDQISVLANFQKNEQTT